MIEILLIAVLVVAAAGCVFAMLGFFAARRHVAETPLSRTRRRRAAAC